MMNLWNPMTREVSGESGMFAGTDTVRLMFPAENVRRVYCSALGIEYLEGRDWHHHPGSDVLTRPEGSGIPMLDDSMLHPADENCSYYPNPDANAVPGGTDGRNVRFDAGNFFARMQIEVDYRASRLDFPFSPPPQTERLARFRALMKMPGSHCRISWLGDSISEGYNASGYLKKPPFQPPFGELTADCLRNSLHLAVDFRNHGRNGANSGYPLTDPEMFLRDKPDLLVIAFGMNDLGNRGGVELYLKNIAEIIRLNRKVSPMTEYLLITPMSGNPEWSFTPLEQTRRFAGALRQFAADSPHDTALADLTLLWSAFLERKSFFDLTGNGVNHPNDYGHRILARGVLNVLDPENFSL